MNLVDLIYKLILPIAKKEGVDPESVANVIKGKKREIKSLEDELDNMFKSGKFGNKKNPFKNLHTEEYK